MRYEICVISLCIGLAAALPAQAQTISTAGGNNAWGGPLGVALDTGGNMYVADWNGSAVYKIDQQANVTKIAGTGVAGTAGEGGPAASAQLGQPSAVAVDTAGNVYIADYLYHKIRKVTVATGIIATVAGSTVGFGGDKGQGASAKLDTPLGLAFDRGGNLYILDYGNLRIRKLTPAGVIDTFAGTGKPSTGATGNQALATDMTPVAIAFGPDGSLYYTDAGFRAGPTAPRVRKIAPNGIVSAVGGNGKAADTGDGGSATSAGFASTDGVAVDGLGNVFVAEYDGSRVRRIDGTTGIITTYAGMGVNGTSGDGGDPTQALLWGPVGLAMDPQGSLYICEYFNKRVRKVALPNIPQIQPVNSGAATFLGQAGFSSNMYMDISGVNLAATTRNWTAADFNGSTAPTSLDGVSVTVNGKPAFVRYVSPTKVGIITPDDTATGPVAVQLQTPSGPSNVGTVTRSSLSPTLQTSAESTFGGNQYVLAETPDLRFFVGGPSIIEGLPGFAVKPGDTVVIYALGCGPITPAAPAGTIVAQDSQLALGFALNIGGVPAGIVSAIAPANTIGLYQFTITIPAVPPGDQPIELVVNGVSNAQNLLISVGQ